MHLLTICCTIMLSFSRPLVGYSAETYESFHAVFDPEYYYEQNPDLQEILGNSGENLFQHFITMGVREGRLGRENFNLKAYVFYNPDLLDTYKTDLLGYCRHYMTVGMAEGRICMPQEEGDNKIGEYTTHYNATIPRAINVELAAQRINGCVLQPGELFSFSDTVQSRIPQNGYVMAPAIGRYEYGGGICQVSSTLYAAMCHALIPAMERHPHSSGVSYLPAGLDATISEGYKDLRFVNIYDKPLKIQVDCKEGVLTVSLWLGELMTGNADETLPVESGQPEQSEQPEPEPSEQPEQSEQPEPSEQPEQSESSEQPEQSEQPEPSEQPEQSESSEQPEQSEQPEPSEQPEQSEQPEPSEQPEQSEQPEPSEQPEQSE